MIYTISFQIWVYLLVCASCQKVRVGNSALVETRGLGTRPFSLGGNGDIEQCSHNDKKQQTSGQDSKRRRKRGYIFHPPGFGGAKETKVCGTWCERGGALVECDTCTLSMYIGCDVHMPGNVAQAHLAYSCPYCRREKRDAERVTQQDTTQNTKKTKKNQMPEKQKLKT